MTRITAGIVNIGGSVTLNNVAMGNDPTIILGEDELEDEEED